MLRPPLHELMNDKSKIMCDISPMSRLSNVGVGQLQHTVYQSVHNHFLNTIQERELNSSNDHNLLGLLPFGLLGLVHRHWTTITCDITIWHKSKLFEIQILSPLIIYFSYSENPIIGAQINH